MQYSLLYRDIDVKSDAFAVIKCLCYISKAW
ncbi:hypothetical protein Phpb_01914 [Photorhabdus namnaonensis]|uniref:Uncharacterized protein n=1 Tax=Photorhabdus namnaonensis TaxID=1851568 RepID=A0A1B8YIR3_9GAMM|nr:hypothetical protein Phpb_01914 [Photorhabdus namnaonensis]